MTRRSRGSGKQPKARRRKAEIPKRRNAPKATRNRQGKVVARLTYERDEALLREAANSEILRLISKSPGDLELVFRAILENAVRICDAKFGTLFRFDGENFYPVAQFNTPAALLEAFTRRGPFKPTPGILLDHVMRTKQVAHSADSAAEPVAGLAQKLGGARSLVCVPMLKDRVLVGAITIYRQEVRPFTDEQIALVQSFADQAVIAIENARLLNELRQRTDDLTESLEQQTATSDVLKVISMLPTDANPVFEAILESACQLCDSQLAAIFRFDGTLLHLTATKNWPAEAMKAYANCFPMPPNPHHTSGRVVLTKNVVIQEDTLADANYEHSSAQAGGWRRMLGVPMLRGDDIIGVVVVTWREPGPILQRQVELLQTFAAQAVIAIENARLLNELRQSLEQQTATSEVLRVISSSPSDLGPVFEAMLANATQLCQATFGLLLLYEGDWRFRVVAIINAPAVFAELRLREPILDVSPETGLGRAVATKDVVHSADYAEEAIYKEHRHPATVGLAELGGARTFLVVPMLKDKDKEIAGAIAIYRQQVRPFTDKQIELVKSFASQAVIAVENARLLNELRERTNQLEEQSQEVVKLNQQLEQRVADQVGEIERMSRLRRFLPPQVADLIVASGTEKQLESHRREITALFCDLRGFTGFSESADPEDVMALLRDYHAAIGQIVIKYGGTLERFAGDGVMVIFNDPVPVENPALQAVLWRSICAPQSEEWLRNGATLVTTSASGSASRMALPRWERSALRGGETMRLLAQYPM